MVKDMREVMSGMTELRCLLQGPRLQGNLSLGTKVFESADVVLDSQSQYIELQNHAAW